MNRRLIEKTVARLKRERGAVHKEWGGRISVCLIFPNTYHVGMSNLGYHGIYQLLNSYSDVVCERAFLPDSGDLELYAKSTTPIVSIESGRPISDFDIAAFSLSFENDYPNIAKILKLCRIPLLASERNHYHPLLMAGGVSVSFNPEPLADIFDLIFIGEAEESLQEFLALYRRNMERSSLYKEALSVDGLYVPAMYEVEYKADGTILRRTPKGNAPAKINKRYVKDISAAPLSTVIYTDDTEFSGMHLIEAMRGCPWKCRFCIVPHFLGPLRTKDIADLRKEVEAAKAGGCSLGVIGPSLSDYHSIEELLSMKDVRFSISSLRASSKSIRLINLMKDRKSVSIAPEAGTERLRRVIRKQITEADVLETAAGFYESGIEILRLYFMIGLPTETDEDMEGIISLAMKVRELNRQRGLVLSVSTFVPKPFTPFQWHAMEELSLVKAKFRKLKKNLEPHGIKIFHDVPKHAQMQGLFAVGDRQLSAVLAGMSEHDDYRKAMAGAGLQLSRYVMRARVFDEILPWEFIESGADKKMLWKEYEEALKK